MASQPGHQPGGPPAHALSTPSRPTDSMTAVNSIATSSTYVERQSLAVHRGRFLIRLYSSSRTASPLNLRRPTLITRQAGMPWLAGASSSGPAGWLCAGLVAGTRRPGDHTDRHQPSVLLRWTSLPPFSFVRSPCTRRTCLRGQCEDGVMTSNERQRPVMMGDRDDQLDGQRRSELE